MNGGLYQFRTEDQKNISVSAVVRTVFFLLLLIICQTNFLYPILGGRVKTTKPDQIQWIYGENLESRTIGFLEFENLTENQKKIYDNYRTSLPRIIADRIKSQKEIETPTNDFIVVQKNLNGRYLIKEIGFTEAEKRKQLMQEIFDYGRVLSVDLVDSFTNKTSEINQTNSTAKVTYTTNFITNQTSLGEVVKEKIVTNQVTVKPENMDFFSALTNRKVAYFFTNAKDKKYVFYIFNKDPQLYFDPNLLSPYLKYFSNAGPHLPMTPEGSLFYPLDRNKRKKLIISDKLFRLNDAPVGDILNQTKIHYFVYGSFKVEQNIMEISLYIINTQEKKITHIFRDRFSSSQIREKSKLMDLMVMSFLQRKKIIDNITFASQPAGALLNLNDRFIGKLPIKLDQWLEGEYRYEIWAPDQIASKVISDSEITDKEINIEKDDSRTLFLFDAEKEGKLKINIDNDIPADYYINAKLKVKNQTDYQENVYPGEYFVRVSKSNYVTRNFKINVEPKMTTSLSFGLNEIQTNSIWDKIFLNYELNTKIFATLGFALGTASFGLFIHTLKLEDQKNSAQKRLEEVKAAGLDTTTETRLRDQYNQDYNKFLSISLGVFSGSMISFITMLIFHTLDVWDNHAPIETKVNHRGDVEIKFSKDL